MTSTGDGLKVTAIGFEGFRTLRLWKPPPFLGVVNKPPIHGTSALQVLAVQVTSRVSPNWGECGEHRNLGHLFVQVLGRFLKPDVFLLMIRSAFLPIMTSPVPVESPVPYPRRDLSRTAELPYCRPRKMTPKTTPHHPSAVSTQKDPSWHHPSAISTRQSTSPGPVP